MEPAFTSRRAAPAPARPPASDLAAPQDAPGDAPEDALSLTKTVADDLRGDPAASPDAPEAADDDLVAAFAADLDAERAAEPWADPADAGAMPAADAAAAPPPPAEASDEAPDDPAVFVLPPRLDTRAATGLAAALLERRGRPLRLDGSGVGFVGATCAQVLVAARASWRRDGQPFAVARGDGLVEGLRALGLDDMIPTEEATG